MNGMIDVGFISDLHLGHEWPAKERGFNTIDEYHEELVLRWNSVCGKRSLIYINGDISMESKKYYHILGRLNGRKVVIGGNHDLKQDTEELLKYVESIIGCLTYKGYIVTHIPIHPDEFYRFKGNIHGHTHGKMVIKRTYKPLDMKCIESIDKRYLNVSWDVLNGIPISFKDLLEKYK